MRSRAMIMLALLVLAIVPAAAAEPTSLEAQDLPEDIIIDPRQGDDEPSIGARPTIDVVRYRQEIAGDRAVVELDFAAPPGEPNTVVDVIGSLGSGLGEGYMFSFRWDQAGELPERASATYTVGSAADPGVDIEAEGRTLRMTLPVPAEATCFGFSASIRVLAADVEYTEWLAPPSGCLETERLDGAAAPCAATQAPSGADPLRATLEDAADDVRRVAGTGVEGDVDRQAPGLYDITRVESRRDGAQIVQVVTLAEPRDPSSEVLLQVFTRTGEGTNADGEPDEAIVVRYWRFANGSQTDRAEGEVRADGEETRFPIELDVEGATYTFRWCASILPTTPVCSIEASAGALTFLSGGWRDTARPTLDACAGRAPTAPATTPPEDDGEAPVEGEEPVGEGEEGGESATPGAPLALLLLAAVALALLRRR